MVNFGIELSKIKLRFFRLKKMNDKLIEFILIYANNNNNNNMTKMV